MYTDVNRSALREARLKLINTGEFVARALVEQDRSEEAVDHLLDVITNLSKDIDKTESNNYALNQDVSDIYKHFDYEIYVVLGETDIMYIGSGKSGRHQHCTSGRSHVKELNEAFFTKKKFEVNVIAEQLSKDVSLHLERILIAYLEPKYNKQWNSVNK